MKNIAIFGAGGLGKEVACLISHINKVKPTWSLIGFFDDGVAKGTKISCYGEVLGGRVELNSWDKDLAIAVAIGNPKTMKFVVDSINNSNINFPNLIYPDAIFYDEDNLSIGMGNIVTPHCLFSCNVNIGDFNIFNGSIAIGHDVNIGSFNTFMPNVVISGETSIGDGNFFGLNSATLQQLNIGDNIMLGTGSILHSNPKSELSYMGNPAIEFRKFFKIQYKISKI